MQICMYVTHNAVLFFWTTGKRAVICTPRPGPHPLAGPFPRIPTTAPQSELMGFVRHAVRIPESPSFTNGPPSSPCLSITTLDQTGRGRAVTARATTHCHSVTMPRTSVTSSSACVLEDLGEMVGDEQIARALAEDGRGEAEAEGSIWISVGSLQDYWPGIRKQP